MRDNVTGAMPANSASAFAVTRRRCLASSNLVKLNIFPLAADYGFELNTVRLNVSLHTNIFPLTLANDENTFFKLPEISVRNPSSLRMLCTHIFTVDGHTEPARQL